jgi:glycosyltransferase involved in cell wall biosynthesis
MWSARGSDILSNRLDKVIQNCGDAGAFLQVGTLVRISSSHGPHLMRTDMTIPQACRAQHFAVSGLSKQAIAKAVRQQSEILHGATHVLAASRWTAESLLRDFDISPHRLSVVYTGGGLRIPHSANESRIRREILFVGFDWERKGGPLLYDAFLRVRKRFTDATLRIVGCRPRIRHPSVFVEGRLDKGDPLQYEQLIRCYLRASCFCLPSLFDPFPNVIIEASSAGLPTVAINNGSRQEAVRHGETGLLVESSDPECLAEALCNLLKDPQRCSTMGVAARHYTRSNFSWQRALDLIGAAVCNRAEPFNAEENVGEVG